MCVNFNAWLVLVVLLGTLAYALAEDLTLTTYYPSPRGVYQAASVSLLTSIKFPCILMQVREERTDALVEGGRRKDEGVERSPGSPWSPTPADLLIAAVAIAHKMPVS